MINLIVPCSRQIGGEYCGAPAREDEHFARHAALELRNVPAERRPRQYRCRLGHTVTVNVAAHIPDPAPDVSRCKSHLQPKPCARCAARQAKRRRTLEAA